MDAKKRRLLITGFVCAVILLVILFFWIRSHRDHRPQESDNVQVAGKIAPGLEPVIRSKGATTGIMDAKEIDATKARKIIAHALWTIVNAKSYKMVMTSLSTSSSGSNVFY